MKQPKLRKNYKKIIEIALNNNIKILMSEDDYYSQNENIRKIKFKCHCGKETTRYGNYFIKQPHCGCMSKKRIGADRWINSLGDFQNREHFKNKINILKNKNIKILTPYKNIINKNSIIKFKCHCGNFSNIKFENIRETTSCGCERYKWKEKYNYFYNNIPKNIIVEHINYSKMFFKCGSKYPIKFKCHCGNISVKSFTSFIKQPHCGCEYEYFGNKYGYVYVLKSDIYSKIKIGYAQNLKERFKAIQKDVFDVFYVDSIKLPLLECKIFEKELHLKYKHERNPIYHYKYSRNGSSEWFNINIMSSVREDVKLKKLLLE